MKILKKAILIVIAFAIPPILGLIYEGPELAKTILNLYLTLFGLQI